MAPVPTMADAMLCRQLWAPRRRFVSDKATTQLPQRPVGRSRLRSGFRAWCALLERTYYQCIILRDRALGLAQKLRQLRDIHRDPPRLVAREQLGRMSALPPKPDMAGGQLNVRFVPIADSCGAAINAALGQVLPDFRKQLTWAEGLRNVIVTACFARLLLLAAERIRRNRDNLD